MPTTTTIVTNAAELTKAIKAATGGETILLAAGNYGNFSVVGRPASEVTIKSLDPANDAVFRSLKLTYADNFRIEHVEVSNPQDAGSTNRAITINSSNHITLVGLNVHGSLDGNAWNDGNGAMIVGSNHIAILNSTFTQLGGAILVGKTTDLTIAGNEITQVREGVQLGEITGGLFDRNYLHDFQPKPTDHSDNFQVQAGYDRQASSGLVFSNNVLIQGSNTLGTHGIYIYSEKWQDGVRHSDITIENNYYEGSALHGISVSYADDVVIRGNTAVSNSIDKPFLVPAVAVQSVHGGIVENNLSSIIIDRKDSGNSDIRWSNNIDVWDPKFEKGMALADIFAPRGDGAIDFGALAARADGAAAGLGFHAVADIGNLSGSADAIVAAYLGHVEPIASLHYAIQ